MDVPEGAVVIGESEKGEEAARHHGAYILERGVWRATCKACGWQAEDPDRRQVASLFRLHITAAKERKAAVTRREGRPAV